jgi:hypothetical protein
MFETDALRITLPVGTLLRSAAGAARCWPLIPLSSSRRAFPPRPPQHTMIVASSQCPSGPDVPFLIVEAIAVDVQVSIAMLLRHQRRNAPRCIGSSLGLKFAMEKQLQGSLSVPREREGKQTSVNVWNPRGLRH